MKNERLKITSGNAKIDVFTYILSLPAGWSCPSAKLCKSMCDRESGKITDGKHTKFRCFMASLEWLKSIRVARWHNFDLLKSLKTSAAIAKTIIKSLEMLFVNDEMQSDKMTKYLRGCPEKDAEQIKFRIHGSGDFYSQKYFDAWLKVANKFPDIIFYAYTKSLKFWINRIDSIPTNLRLTASIGGTQDNLIKVHNLKYVEVVLSEQEAIDKGLEIDHNDSLCWGVNGSFALLIHGTQPKGSEASKANALLRKTKKNGYKMNINPNKK